MRYFANDYYKDQSTIGRESIVKLINEYVSKILQYKNYCDGDLYVGTSGIAFMFLKLYQSNIEELRENSLESALKFSNDSMKHIRNKPEDSVAFLCGNAGIYAVNTIINQESSNHAEFESSLSNFLKGVQPSLNLFVNNYGSDEILFGRAGYLSGIYWLNQNLKTSKIPSKVISQICDKTIESGAHYSDRKRLPIPMMWECYGDKYIGAAHGVSAILHMLLESPLFEEIELIKETNEKRQKVKKTLDFLLSTQSADGNFPCTFEEHYTHLKNNEEYKLVHWCHGAPGVFYVFAKAYLLFKDPKYLEACLKCGELIWKKGLLKKGPGICHGIAGNGYVFLILYRLTSEEKHLFRAFKFAEFLTSKVFIKEAKIPDHPMSLYEGLAGTVCFLVDLLQPEKAEFPFMDVFNQKFESFRYT